MPVFLLDGAFVQLKEAYEQMQAQPTTAAQGMSDESGTDNDSKVRWGLGCGEWCTVCSLRDLSDCTPALDLPLQCLRTRYYNNVDVDAAEIDVRSSHALECVLGCEVSSLTESCQCVGKWDEIDGLASMYQTLRACGNEHHLPHSRRNIMCSKLSWWL